MVCAVKNSNNNLAGGNSSLQLAPADVCLVCMPYCNPEKPSLALGLLQVVLAEGGINARSIYANLLFCEILGVDLYRRNHHADPRLPLAEWSFASSAFPEFQPDENQFAGEIHARLGGIRQQSLEECREELRLVRQRAEEFTAGLAEQILKLSPRIVGCTSSDKRLLALAIEEPYLEYLSGDQNPLGYISSERKSMLGQPIEFMKSYIKDMASKGLLDSRYLPADCE